MPVFSPEYLHKAAYHIYRAKGTPEAEAEVVAAHLVKANLYRPRLPRRHPDSHLCRTY